MLHWRPPARPARTRPSEARCEAADPTWHPPIYPAPWMVPDDVKSVNYRTVPPFRAAPARYDRPIQPDVRLRRMRRASPIVAKAVIVLAAILAAADAAGR